MIYYLIYLLKNIKESSEEINMIYIYLIKFTIIYFYTKLMINYAYCSIL